MATEQATLPAQYCAGRDQNPDKILHQLRRRSLDEEVKTFATVLARLRKKSDEVTTNDVLAAIAEGKLEDDQKARMQEIVHMVGRCRVRVDGLVGALPFDDLVHDVECPGCGTTFTVRRTPPDEA